jgi:toxin YoeB
LPGWVERDRTQALRIIRLIREIQRDPLTGLGKPEPLKHELSGCWSRRIDQEHRLVYQVLKDKDPNPGLPLPLLANYLGVQFSDRNSSKLD